eukprot:SAG31_NODE_16583_length_703_cov_1.188742_2_plen_27_part_01
MGEEGGEVAVALAPCLTAQPTGTAANP